MRYEEPDTHVGAGFIRSSPRCVVLHNRTDNHVLNGGFNAFINREKRGVEYESNYH